MIEKLSLRTHPPMINTTRTCILHDLCPIIWQPRCPQSIYYDIWRVFFQWEATLERSSITIFWARWLALVVHFTPRQELPVCWRLLYATLGSNMNGDYAR